MTFDPLLSVSMNTNMMEAMGGNGALGRRRRKKRADDLRARLNDKLGGRNKFGLADLYLETVRRKLTQLESCRSGPTS